MATKQVAATEQLTVSLETDARSWIDEAVQSGQITDTGAFISALILDYRERVRIENLLLEGLASGEPVAPDAGFWKRKKEVLRKRMSK